jgi:hypothetical protein
VKKMSAADKSIVDNEEPVREAGEEINAGFVDENGNGPGVRLRKG